MPLPSDDSPCPFCLDDGVAHYDRIHRLGTFDDPLKDLIHKMKYSGRWALAEDLAERLWAQPKVQNLLANADLLVPIPLHFFRRVQRGYNQAGLIARALAKKSGKPVVSVLKRTRNTQSQTQLYSKEKRYENMRNAFAVRVAGHVKGKHVVVIDDVMTTGATLQTAARALRPEKPAMLSALVIAVADPKRRHFQAV